MKDIADITVCFVDHGLFLPLARKFGNACKRVLYHTPYEEGFSTVDKGFIGRGFPEIERCDDVWGEKDNIDLFVFPDIEHAGMQEELRKQGYAVWGAGYGDQLELDRVHFMEVLKELELEVPPHKIVSGLEELSEYLLDKKDCYIKISKYRGSMETTHWRSWEEDRGFLDLLSVRLGPPARQTPFLVFDAIDTPIEIGSDTYCVDGVWPNLMLHGIEAKDRAYLSAVTNTDDMPDCITDILDEFSSVLKRYGYRSQWSMEVRVKDEKAYFIDPTCRGGLPSTGSAMDIWGNFANVIWHGAHGVLIDPEPVADFSAEVIVEVKGEPKDWRTINADIEVGDALKLADCCRVGDVIAFPPNRGGGREIGWLVATGDTPTEAVEALKALVKKLPDGCSADVTPLADIIQEIQEAEKSNIEFTGKPMPEPAIVVEDAT